MYACVRACVCVCVCVCVPLIVFCLFVCLLAFFLTFFSMPIHVDLFIVFPCLIFKGSGGCLCKGWVGWSKNNLHLSIDKIMYIQD
jgi:hypothetical protein